MITRSRTIKDKINNSTQNPTVPFNFDNGIVVEEMIGTDNSVEERKSAPRIIIKE